MGLGMVRHGKPGQVRKGSLYCICVCEQKHFSFLMKTRDELGKFGSEVG